MLAVGTRLAGPNGEQTIELVAPLGGGFFGQVYRAIDTTSGQQLAVKVPRTALLLGDDAEALAFRSDMRAAGEIKHPNVVDIFWASSATEPPYIVMEFVSGGTLDAELKRRIAARDQVPLSLVRLWFDDVVSGMAAINKVFLHRDIKPDNILLADGRLKITDFGLSKLIDAATRTQSFKGGGALLYMAPEVWRGESNRIQRDMYAVGLTLFQLSSLQYPLPLGQNPNQEHIRQAHLYTPPRRLRDCRTDVPIAVEHVVMRLFAKREKDRFATWEDVQRALATAWDSDHAEAKAEPSVSAAEAQIISAVTASRVSLETAQTAAQRAHEREREVARAAEHRWTEMLAEIEAQAERLKMIGAISIERGGTALNVRIDGKAVADARLISLRDEYRFRNGDLASFIGAFNTICGTGFNAVLRREGPDDLYGSWDGAEFRRNYLFLVGRTVVDKPEPFALTSADLPQRLSAMDGATSDIQRDHVGDIPGRFLQLLADCLASRSGIAGGKPA